MIKCCKCQPQRQSMLNHMALTFHVYVCCTVHLIRQIFCIRANINMLYFICHSRPQIRVETSKYVEALRPLYDDGMNNCKGDDEKVDGMNNCKGDDEKAKTLRKKAMVITGLTELEVKVSKYLYFYKT